MDSAHALYRVSLLPSDSTYKNLTLEIFKKLSFVVI